MMPSSAIVQSAALPPLVTIEQPLANDALPDPVAAAVTALDASPVARKVKPGMRVALAVGSRGIDRHAALVRGVADWLKSRGALPFLVPAMGSHGRATAEGQVELLAELGITEDSAGCPIVSSMETVVLGELDNGFRVHMDKHAHAADGILVLNRVKPHTSFRGPHESGLVKMVAIGLGKQVGADSCHALGYDAFSGLLPKMAAVSITQSRLLGGLAVVENALDKLCHAEAVPVETLMERDRELLVLAAARMPRLPFPALDVLIIDEMGKNITGAGVDYNIIGRYTNPSLSGGPNITRVGVLDLTRESHGNAVGMGVVDFISRRLRDKLDFEATYVNTITSTALRAGAMPVAMACDRDVFLAAVKTSLVARPEDLRLVRIRNTLSLKRMRISPALVPPALEAGCRLLGKPEPIPFTEQGDLVGLCAWDE